MANARVAKLREYEDKLNAMKCAVKDEQRAAAVATWQNKSDEKMRDLTVQRRFAALTARREADLNSRRQRLAQKLHDEDAAYQQELLSGKETPEQRRAKLAARARELAARREAERQQLASQLAEQAFVENCDVLRDTNSKRVMYRTLEERQAQIEQKMCARIAEAEEARMFAELNEAQHQAVEQRYADDKRKDKERKEATVKVLDEQVRALNMRRADEAAARAAEVGELRALWDRLAAEQEAEEAAERGRMAALAAELQEFNRLRHAELSERDRRERELDLQILQEALAKEAAQEAAEASARRARSEEVRRYRAQLAQMMVEEEAANSGRDAAIEAVAAAQQAKQDAEWAAREAARQRLLAEVNAVRQLQIAEKAAAYATAHAQRDADRAAAEEAAAEEAADAQARQAAANKRALEARLGIQTQMVARAHIKAAEEDEKLRALEAAAAAERDYMGRVAGVIGKTDPPKWYGRKKHEWFT